MHDNDPAAGARTFHEEWANLVPQGATVWLCHDADSDGDAGAATAARMLRGATMRVRPPEGTDWCDWEGDTAAFLALARAAEADKPSGRRVELIPASAIFSRRVRWAWKGRLPLRSMCVVAGEKGLGKSTLTNAYLPALLSKGQLEGDLFGEPHDVIVVTAEDDESVVKSRLVAHGADLTRVKILNVRDTTGESLLTLPEDVDILAAEIQSERDSGRKAPW